MRLSPPEPGEGDSEVPPAIMCAVCLRPECPGCAPAAPSSGRAHPLSWEHKTGSLSERLWDTALSTSLEPVRTFGQLSEGGLGKAVSFAVFAETLAIASLGAFILGVLSVLAPDWSIHMLVSPAGAAFVIGLSLVLSFAMVLLHAVWGICVELGARSTGRKARFKQGIRFGLYACGWDLLTSPAGVVQGLVSRGFTGAWGPILAAMRAPRAAMRAYVEQYRNLDEVARRRGVQLSVLVLGSLVVLLGTGLLLGPMLVYARYLGY